MPKAANHKWMFAARFRRHAFGWRSQPAIARVKEAVSEIAQVARYDSVLAAEGGVLFLEKISPALEHVDSSSGAIGRPDSLHRAARRLLGEPLWVQTGCLAVRTRRFADFSRARRAV